VVVFVAYASIATVVRAYPFSTFDMYAHPEDTASHLVARDATGRVGELTGYVGWSCELSVDSMGLPERCGPLGTFSITTYKDQDLLRWVARHTAADPRAEPVDIVRRIWQLEDRPGPPAIRDCLLGHCRAVRR
jgi:hypothetical protein